jgi:hypothetical protein
MLPESDKQHVVEAELHGSLRLVPTMRIAAQSRFVVRPRSPAMIVFIRPSRVISRPSNSSSWGQICAVEPRTMPSSTVRVADRGCTHQASTSSCRCSESSRLLVSARTRTPEANRFHASSASRTEYNTMRRASFSEAVTLPKSSFRKSPALIPRCKKQTASSTDAGHAQLQEKDDMGRVIAQRSVTLRERSHLQGHSQQI